MLGGGVGWPSHDLTQEELAKVDPSYPSSLKTQTWTKPQVLQGAPLEFDIWRS